MSPLRLSSARATSRWFDRVLVTVGGLLLVLAVYWFIALIGAPTAPSPPPQQVDESVRQADDVATDDALLVDDAFGVAMSGRALRRIVQVLQWREVASVPLAVGDEVVSDRGDYQLLWSERLIDSSRFAEPNQYINPPAPPYRSWSVGAQSTTRVDSEISTAWRAVPTSQLRLPDNLMAIFRAEGAWLITTPEGDLPQAGDLRVRFELLPQLSVADHDADNADEVASAAADPVAAALVWIARASAFILALVGAGLILRGAAGLAPAGGLLDRLPAIAVLSLSIWIAVAAALVAAAISWVF